MKITFEDWGKIEYKNAWIRQQQLFDQALLEKQKGGIVRNHIVFCEHPSVVTLGRNANPSHLLFSEAQLKKKNVSLFRTDRGGEATYHGPGQLVVYPVIDLVAFGLGLKKYILLLEEIVILLLKERYGIRASRFDGAAGVWLDTEIPKRTRKICAVGVKSSRYITMHGIALNVNTDLSFFSLINPCGFVDKGVTSIQEELQEKQDMQQCKAWVKEGFMHFLL